ncbi:hypothetical protein BpHYR1_053513 [Brachionus plicatilis]|uniref:Uncharacterized protein n=1 Tax=Brachionus plicatilis TaxID=10195 RepID=A0A3M7RNH7_BRAPC|nr:hypothetical protein BpHYR1_053513 [Brachionus plicatilis]
MDFLRRDLDAKLLRSPHMMPALSPNMYSHVTKHAGAHTALAKPVLTTGLVQYYPRTSGKWCAAHAKVANMIQEQKAKSKQRASSQPQFCHQPMFDAYHSKKLHTPTFFPPVQHNLKPNQTAPRAPPPPHNYLATEAAVTAAANHHLMMDKYRQDMMRLGAPPPPSMANMMPPAIPMMPPPGLHMPPFHSFLQQFFMDKNFDPTRFPFPPQQQHLPPPPPPGCLMPPNMLKPDDKPIT